MDFLNKKCIKGLDLPDLDQEQLDFIKKKVEYYSELELKILILLKEAANLFEQCGKVDRCLQDFNTISEHQIEKGKREISVLKSDIYKFERSISMLRGLQNGAKRYSR